MGRKILGVIAGYLVSALWVVATLSIAFVALGADWAFEDGTLDTSTGWAVLMLVLGFVGAVIGGWLAALIGRGPQAATWLAIVMLVGGFSLAAFNRTVDHEARSAEVLAGRSPSEVTTMEAASIARAPFWYDWAIPIVGALGALTGGRCRTGRRPAA